MTNQPNNIKEEAMKIADRFANFGHPIAVDKIEEKLAMLVTRFRVVMPEAIRNVTEHFRKEQGIDKGEFFNAGAPTRGPHPQMKIGDITLAMDGKYIDLKGSIAQLWDATSDKIKQSGLVGDETGVIKFTIWQQGCETSVDEGKAYIFNNVRIGNWQGQLSISTTRESSITNINETIEVHKKLETIYGAIVNIQGGSGLIKRCPECNRSLNKGACGEHGNVKGITDLRIKANLDDGITVTDLIADRKTTEEILGITFEQAKDLATEAVDPRVVVTLIEKHLLGKYWQVTGIKAGTNLLVDTIVPMQANIAAQITIIEKSIADAAAATAGGN